MTRKSANLNRPWAIQPLSTLGLVAGLLGLGACPGNLGFDYGGGGMGGDSCNITSVLQSKCAICHTNPPQAIYASLDLMSPDPGPRLVGVVASSSGKCMGMGNLIDKATLPATGILIDKINDHQTCGAFMPATGMRLDPADNACIQQWANGLVASTP